MTHCTIVIQSLEDAKNGKGIIDIKLEDSWKIKEATELTIGILEKGTSGGQVSFMFMLEMSDGTFSMSQITANMFESLISIYNGAVQRFENNNASKN